MNMYYDICQFISIVLSVEFDLQTSLLNSPWYTIIIVPAFTVIEALIRNKLGIAN
jgi:hypothetical protein